jgi:putative DNA primase/helicase
MLYGSELNKEQHLDLARIKRLTSREGMEVARFTNRNDFEFKRTGKITITGNNKPVIGHVDLAIKRRLVLWHFMHEVPNPDGALKDKLTPEYPGILWKLIVGASEVLATIAAGGTLWDLVPQAVRQSSADYLVEEDAVARWLGERCDTGVSYRVGVTEAHADYDAWCCGEEHLPVSVRKFGGEVKRAAGVMGVPIEVRHTSAGNVLTGIKLKPNKL